MGRVLLTVPAHNEEKWLYKTIVSLNRALRESALDFRLAVAEDGSTDNTLSILKRLKEEIPELIVQSLPHRAGRGFALRTLWARVDADVYAFVDADLATSCKSVLSVLNACLEGTDIAIGSRYVAGAVVNRPPLRALVSRAYNALVRIVFSEQIADHQCGLKAFTKETVNAVLPLCNEDSWVWDTEILVLSNRLGFKIAELPVSWREYRVLRTPLKRLVADIRLHGTALIRLKATVSKCVVSTSQPVSAQPKLADPVRRELL